MPLDKWRQAIDEEDRSTDYGEMLLAKRTGVQINGEMSLAKRTGVQTMC